METFFEYLLKASGVLFIFYGAYQLFLKRETFFVGNRHFLLGGILCALLVPFIYVTRYVEAKPIVYGSLTEVAATQAAASGNTGIDWVYLLGIVYMLGVAVLFIKFFLQLVSLLRLLREHRVRKEDGHIYVETEQGIPPFSFFNRIVYNPSLYNREELEAILIHEKAHSSQWHSIDILLGHLLSIILWPNPICWLYKKNMQQNLEFLADASAQSHVASMKTYQLTLMKVSGISYYNTIANNFYNSLIKKRIVMLHKSKSSKKNVFKYMLVLPFLAVFMLIFNVRTEARTIPMTEQYTFAVEPAIFGNAQTYVISNDMDDSDIESLKGEIASTGAKLSVKKVKRNGNGKIVSIAISYKSAQGGQVTGQYDDDDGLPPISFGQRSNGGLFITSGDPEHMNKPTHMIHVESDDDDHENDAYKVIINESGEGSGSNHVWASSDDGEKRVVKITEVDGKKKITVNGKVVTEEELGEMDDDDVMHVRVKKGKGKNTNSVMIIKDSDDEEDIEIIEEDGSGFFFIDTDGDEKPLFYIDGKEVSREEVKALSPDKIKSIDVSKGDGAIEKYGDKAKNGVVEITTKDNE